jgi:hypothetical protein
VEDTQVSESRQTIPFYPLVEESKVAESPEVGKIVYFFPLSVTYCNPCRVKL